MAEVLDAVAAIDLHLTVVVHPRNAEHDDALRFDQTVSNSPCSAYLGCWAMYGHRLFDDFGNGLQELRLPPGCARLLAE